MEISREQWEIVHKRFTTGSKFPVIPMKILCTKKLNPTSKVLYAGIVSLSAGVYCYVKNEVLESVTGLPTRTITDHLSKLSDKKIISMENINNTRVIKLLSLKNKLVEQKRVKHEEPFRSWGGELDVLYHSKKRYLEIIALFIEHKKIRFDNRGQLNKIIKRNVRVARELEDFSGQQLKDGMAKCDKEHHDINWTLETLLKVLTK